METPERVKNAIQAGIQAVAARKQAEADLAAKKTQEAELKRRMELLEKALQPKTITAWCADATEDATGGAVTIEINGEMSEIDPLLVIAPQEVRPTLPAGEVVAREVQSGAQLYFNAAILPGWQRFKPTYRAGRIVTLDRIDNTCTVDLDPAKSSAERLDINQATRLVAVPVRYMTCDAAAFEADDHVIVEFQAQDWAQPVVIGFVQRPRPCTAIAIAMRFEVRAPQYPGQNEEDWLLRPSHTVYCEFDPETGEFARPGRMANDWEYSGWIEGGPLDYFQYYYTEIHVEPFVWQRKTWIRRETTMNTPQSGRIIAHDGTIVDFADARSLTADGKEIVGLPASNENMSVVVFDAATRAQKRTWTFDDYVLRVKTRAGLAVLWSGSQDTAGVRVINHRTGAALHTVILGGIGSLIDVAINTKFFAVILLLVGSNARQIRIYSMATGELVDFRPADGAEAIAMNEKYLVGVCASGDYGAPLGKPYGGVNVWRIGQDGLLTLFAFDYPIAAEGDSGAPYAA